MELCVEMIQGTSKANLMIILNNVNKRDEKSYFIRLLLSTKTILNNNLNNSETLYKVRLDIMNFITAFIEEKNTPMQIIGLIENIFNPIMIFDSIIGRDYITSLIYMFLISLIGTIMRRGEIIYAFTLLAILDLNNTLKGIAISIKLRGPELGASFLLLIFLVYFYSNIGFFYLNDHFKADIENDIPDNYCLCLSFCFMTNFDAGIRARGGAADQMIRISFERHTKLYVIRLIYDVSYFLINIIIMIDLVFGIILGTFSKMREEEREYDNDKINHCFICHITREIIEKRKENFQFHREKRHNLWNYINYMLFLKFSDVNKLNVTNLFTKMNLDNKNICFLPSYLDNYEEDGQKEKEKDEEEKEEEEDTENEDEEEESDTDSDDSSNIKNGPIDENDSI
jgi:hypothetical protein